MEQIKTLVVKSCLGFCAEYILVAVFYSVEAGSKQIPSNVHYDKTIICICCL